MYSCCVTKAHKNIAACASEGPRSCANTCPSPFGLLPPTYLSLVSLERRHFLRRREPFSFHTPVCRACSRACLHIPANHLNPSFLPSFLLAALSVLFPRSLGHYVHPRHMNKEYFVLCVYSCVSVRNI